jgi:hypothetical protein
MDKLAPRYGRKPETVDRWRTDAVVGLEDALRWGTGKGTPELEPERVDSLLKEVITRQTRTSELLGHAEPPCPTSFWPSRRSSPSSALGLMNTDGHALSGSIPPEATPRRRQVVVPEPNRRLAPEFTTVWSAEEGVVVVAVTVDGGCRSVLDVTVRKAGADRCPRGPSRWTSRRRAHHPRHARGVRLARGLAKRPRAARRARSRGARLQRGLTAPTPEAAQPGRAPLAEAGTRARDGRCMGLFTTSSRRSGTRGVSDRA